MVATLTKEQLQSVSPLLDARLELERLLKVVHPNAGGYQDGFIRRTLLERSLIVELLRFLDGLTKAYGSAKALSRLGSRLWKDQVVKAYVIGKTDDVNRQAIMFDLLMDRSAAVSTERLFSIFALSVDDSLTQSLEVLGVRTTRQFPASSLSTPVGVYRNLFPDLVSGSTSMLSFSHSVHAREMASAIINLTNPARPASTARIVRELRRINKTLTLRQARTIARTEISTIHGAVGYRTMLNNGVRRRRWITAAMGSGSGGSGVCPICIGNAMAGWVPVTNAFPSGDHYVPAHPNCRCDTIPDLSDWAPRETPWPISESVAGS